MAPDKRPPRKSHTSTIGGSHTAEDAPKAYATPLSPKAGSNATSKDKRSSNNRSSAASKNTRSRGNAEAEKTDASTSPESGLPLRERISANTRITEDYYFFHGGPLSNWHSRGPPFKGQRALDIAMPLLKSAGVEHPAASTVSSQLLAQHWYNCGEQWMMACKAWLMETLIGAADVSTIPGGFQALQSDIYRASPSADLGPDGLELHASTLAEILRASHPKDQKALGRCVQNWNEERWQAACMPVVIAGSYARAEATPILKEIYMDNAAGQRRFCEGSSTDVVWGVGIRWDNPVINNPRHWKGQNLLGKCHDEACRLMAQALNRDREREEEA